MLNKSEFINVALSELSFNDNLSPKEKYDASIECGNAVAKLHDKFTEAVLKRLEEMDSVSVTNR